MCLAVPGRIVEITEEADPALRHGTVDFSGVRKDVSLAFTPEAQTGDYVIVHVGFAISKVDEAEAKRTFEALEEMSQLDELEFLKDAIPPGMFSSEARR
jgi:hydrogenase expression/formation protein HypC